MHPVEVAHKAGYGSFYVGDLVDLYTKAYEVVSAGVPSLLDSADVGEFLSFVELYRREGKLVMCHSDEESLLECFRLANLVGGKH